MNTSVTTLTLLESLRHLLASEQQALNEQWHQQRNTETMLSARCALVDRVLAIAWADSQMPEDSALVAVGGYGRGELYPYSDVDLLILLADDTKTSAIEAPLAGFISKLWDIGLDIGQSVRTRDECLAEAENDITVKTALLEARMLNGAAWVFEDFQQSFRAALDPVSFLKAKRLEQAERHSRHNDTPYALEPNCKESPGGLRDLQVILWCARGAGVGGDWSALAHAGLLRAGEARQLALVERRLQEVRIDLHLLAGRAEDRFLFDVQERLAAAMGIVAEGTRRASEVMMQRYYRNARRVMLINSLVLPALADHIDPDRHPAPIVINEHFQSIREMLDIRDADLFEHNPACILECFRLQMQRGELQGMTPRTQRALWHARHLIDDEFRADPQNRALFISLFQQKHLVRVLRRMNQYNIIGRYLPAFGDIVGRMQHDLFHAYTVDQHILLVIRNLRRLDMLEFAHEYPFCSRLMNGFDRRWRLYLGALFHDIAKGRGGDHSQLGMADAREFCKQHGLNDADTDLIVFLVGNHLTMSSVAQKQDLTDPDVVSTFANVVGTMERLTALYLLTVADIRGTSPKVWNSWKAKLLEDLFRMTAAKLQGESNAQSGGLNERQEEARRLLRQRGLRPDIEADLWSRLDTAYFMRHDAEEIAWHARTLYYRTESPEAVVSARVDPKFEGIQVMVYVADQPQLFARLCYVFARLGYSIGEAKVHTTRHSYALDSFMVFSTNPQEYRDTAALLEHQLAEQLKHHGQHGPLPPAPTSRLSRQVRHFPITPEVEIRADERGGHYIMSINAADRSGLLYAVAVILAKHEIRLHSAKITTLGERVEDVFLISGKKLSSPASLIRLEQDLLAALAI
jgi:[protein-PII] uridylyltransferase